MYKMDEFEMTHAERMYKNHFNNVIKYQKNNAGKIRQKQKDNLLTIKKDPIKYKALQVRRHDYYLKVKAAAVVKAVLAPEPEGTPAEEAAVPKLN